MDLTLLLPASFYGLVALMAVAFFIQRLRSGRAKSRRSKWGYFPLAAAIAFQQLNAIVRPHEQHVIQAMYDETADEDNEGAPEDPTIHLHRQAGKIRKGKLIDRLTAIVDPDRPNNP